MLPADAAEIDHCKLQPAITCSVPNSTEASVELSVLKDQPIIPLTTAVAGELGSTSSPETFKSPLRAKAGIETQPSPLSRSARSSGAKQ